MKQNPIEQWTIAGGDDHRDLEEFTVTILADTDTVPDETGYERMVILKDWNPWATDQLGKIHYRVGQHPGDSFAFGHIWNTDLGWLVQSNLPVADFWSWMPGYTRGHTDRANRQGRVLVKDLILLLRESAVEIHENRLLEENR